MSYHIIHAVGGISYPRHRFAARLNNSPRFLWNIDERFIFKPLPPPKEREERLLWMVKYEMKLLKVVISKCM